MESCQKRTYTPICTRTCIHLFYISLAFMCQIQHLHTLWCETNTHACERKLKIIYCLYAYMRYTCIGQPNKAKCIAFDPYTKWISLLKFHIFWPLYINIFNYSKWENILTVACRRPEICPGYPILLAGSRPCYRTKILNSHTENRIEIMESTT